jgi:hypothetical protein
MITYKVTVDEYGTTRWFNEDGLRHRLDGPAVECANGDKFWYQNGKYHRLDGPACVTSCGYYKAWWVNGDRHRLDGPAIEYPSGDKEWFIENKQYTETEFLAKIDKMNRPCIGKKIVVEGVEYTLA